MAAGDSSLKNDPRFSYFGGRLKVQHAAFLAAGLQFFMPIFLGVLLWIAWKWYVFAALVVPLSIHTLILFNAIRTKCRCFIFWQLLCQLLGLCLIFATLLIVILHLAGERKIYNAFVQTPSCKESFRDFLFRSAKEAAKVGIKVVANRGKIEKVKKEMEEVGEDQPSCKDAKKLENLVWFQVVTMVLLVTTFLLQFWFMHVMYSCIRYFGALAKKDKEPEGMPMTTHPQPGALPPGTTTQGVLATPQPLSTSSLPPPPSVPDASPPVFSPPTDPAAPLTAAAIGLSSPPVMGFPTTPDKNQNYINTHYSPPPAVHAPPPYHGF